MDAIGRELLEQRNLVRGLRQPGFSGLHSEVASRVRASGGDFFGCWTRWKLRGFGQRSLWTC